MTGDDTLSGTMEQNNERPWFERLRDHWLDKVDDEQLRNFRDKQMENDDGG